MSQVTLTLDEPQADLVRRALVEYWEDQSKVVVEEVGDNLGGESTIRLEDAAWKVREMNMIVDLLDKKLGWDSTYIPSDVRRARLEGI